MGGRWTRKYLHTSRVMEVDLELGELWLAGGLGRSEGSWGPGGAWAFARPGGLPTGEKVGWVGMRLRRPEGWWKVLRVARAPVKAPRGWVKRTLQPTACNSGG